MFDILSNHKICNFRTHATQTAGAAYQPDSDGVDMQEENVTTGLFERNTRGLLLIEVTDVNTTGDVTIVVQDKNDEDLAWAELCTLDKIEETGLFYVDLKGFKKNVRLAATVADASVVWGAKLISFDAVRRPVVQSDADEVTATYATGR